MSLFKTIGKQGTRTNSKETALGMQTVKTDQKVICWHKISREKPLQAARRSSKPRETVLQAAWESSTARAKLDTSSLISREEVSQTAQNSDRIVQSEMISRETKKDFARKCRPVLQTATNFEVINRLFRPIGQIFKINFSEQADNQARRIASKWCQARLKTMSKGKSNLAHEQSSDLVRANP